MVAAGWRVVLGFQTLCNRFVPDACKVEDFSALYMIRTEGDRFFIARSSLEKVMVNLADSDYGRRDTIIQVSGAWETIV